MTLLAEVARASARVAQNPGRLAKVREIAALLKRLEPDEIEVAIPFLSGELRQGKLSIGYGAVDETLGDNSHGIDALAGSPYARQLRKLNLSGMNLVPDDIFRLSRFPCPGRLSALDIAHNSELQTWGWWSSVDSSISARLEELLGVASAVCARTGQQNRRLTPFRAIPFSFVIHISPAFPPDC